MDMTFDDEIRRGLRAAQKRLPAALLYDDLGSALFEVITHLPEYPVGRVDDALLSARTPEVLAALPGPLELLELGPGSGRKALRLLGPLSARQGAVRFTAVDVSVAALQACVATLRQLPSVEVVAVAGGFLDGLSRAPLSRPGHQRLVLFLGSNLSNFSRAEAASFLTELRGQLSSGDALLLSADLIKPPERLLPAYDDALGVTAAFNRNLLVRLNRQWGANFPLPLFAHEVRWNAAGQRVEMHLRALAGCSVTVARLDLTVRFEPGETIWTESSHRFEVSGLRSWGENAGFTCAGQWTDADWPLALTLFLAR